MSGCSVGATRAEGRPSSRSSSRSRGRRGGGRRRRGRRRGGRAAAAVGERASGIHSAHGLWAVGAGGRRYTLKRALIGP
jgi:hypothetical protein